MGVVGQINLEGSESFQRKAPTVVLGSSLSSFSLRCLISRLGAAWKSPLELERLPLQAVVEEVSVRCEFGRKLDQMGPQQVLWILETSYQIFNILFLQRRNSQWLNS